MKKIFKPYIYGFLGNIFDHYEIALYGLLAPVFAKLFFPNDSQIISYIKSYAIFPLFLFSRLLGAWYFGKIGDKKGTSFALSYTLFGMSFVAILIGSIPAIKTIGIHAPLIFFLLLMLQNFFASGEKTGGILYILENSSSKQKPITSCLYDSSSILGYILASILVVTLGDKVSVYWRFLYFFSAIGSFLGFLIRRNISFSCYKNHVSETPKSDYKKQLSIVFTVCFSYALYYITMTLMNSWIPLTTSISYSKTLHMNIYLLILDAIFLPFVGILSYKYGSQKVMRISIYLNLLLVIPLFYLFKTDSLFVIYIARICLIFCAVLFSAPCHYFAFQKTSPKNRFKTIAIANVIGAHIGKTSPVITYWIYQKTQLIVSPALPILGFGVLAWYFLKEKDEQTALDILPS